MRMGVTGFEPPAKPSGKPGHRGTGAPKSAPSHTVSETGSGPVRTGAAGAAGGLIADAAGAAGRAEPNAPGATSAAELRGPALAEALALLARLPLSDGERAELVRRLLAAETAANGQSVTVTKRG